MSEQELTYRYAGTKEGAAKAVRGNLEAMREVYRQLDESDVVQLVREVYKQQGGSHDGTTR